MPLLHWRYHAIFGCSGYAITRDLLPDLLPDLLLSCVCTVLVSQVLIQPGCNRLYIVFLVRKIIYVSPFEQVQDCVGIMRLYDAIMTFNLNVLEPENHPCALAAACRFPWASLAGELIQHLKRR